MNLCTCFLLLRIFADTHTFATNTPKSNQRSVNLALETVLEFNNKDKESDLNFLNKVQNFITKVKTVIDGNTNRNNLRRSFVAPRVKTFTDFIQDVIQVLITYDDTAFTDFFDILDEEIRNYHYRGCRFYELTENYETRKLIATQLDSIKSNPASVTKENINALLDMLIDDNYDRNVKEIVVYINSLYKEEASEIFQNVITDLVTYGRSKSKRSINKLATIIKNGIRTIIFDHYTNLNANVRRNVRRKIETFWENFGKNNPSRYDIPHIKPYSISRKNVKNSENMMNEVKKSDIKIGVNKKYENSNDRTEIKQAEYKKPEMNRNNLKSERKRFKDARKDAVFKPFDAQENETRLGSQYIGLLEEQWVNNENQGPSDSSTGESYSSIEFYEEPQKNTTLALAIIPAKITQKPSTNATKKSETIGALNVTTGILRNDQVRTIWIEESTGRLPKAVLDKLAIKPSVHETKHNMTQVASNKHKKKYDKDKKKWHGKTYEEKYLKMNGKSNDKKHDNHIGRTRQHWSKNYTKYESSITQTTNHVKKQKNDETTTPTDPFILIHNRDFFRQHYVRTTESVFTMEVPHEYKRGIAPLRMELKQNIRQRWLTPSTKAQKFLEVVDVLMPSAIISPRARRTDTPRQIFNEKRRMRITQRTSPRQPTNSSLRRLTLTVPWAYSIKNKMDRSKSDRHFKKSTDYMSSDNEGTFRLKQDKRRYGENAQSTSSNSEKDPYIVDRIKNLERQLKEVKSKIHGDTAVVTAKAVTHSIGGNDEVVNKTKFGSDVHRFVDNYKVREDTLNITGAAENHTKPMIGNKYVKDEDTKINEIEQDIEKGEKPEINFRSNVSMSKNDFEDKTDKTIQEKHLDYQKDVKDKNFKNKEEIIDDDYEIEKVTKRKRVIKKNIEPEISLARRDVSTTTAKDEEVKFIMHDLKEDASKQTVTQNINIASTSTSTKATTSPTTKATEPTTIITTSIKPPETTTTPTTLKSSTTSITTSVATSSKPTEVFKTSEINSTVDESKNKMANITTKAADISKTITVATE